MYYIRGSFFRAGKKVFATKIKLQFIKNIITQNMEKSSAFFLIFGEWPFISGGYLN